MDVRTAINSFVYLMYLLLVAWSIPLEPAAFGPVHFPHYIIAPGHSHGATACRAYPQYHRRNPLGLQFGDQSTRPNPWKRMTILILWNDAVDLSWPREIK